MDRIYEIDIVRGFAVIAMVIFHYFYIFYLMGESDTAVSNSLVACLANFAHITFIILFGVNLALSYQRNKEKGAKDDDYFGKQMKRALTFYIIGAIVTLFTYLIFPHKYVVFGIFHFLATSIILSQFFVENKTTAVLGLVIFYLVYSVAQTDQYNILNRCYNSPLFCFVTGLGNTQYNSIDHFSLLPYFMFVLIGIILGHTYFDKGNRRFKYLENKDSKYFTIIKKIGQNSIPIYIMHWFILYYLIKKPDRLLLNHN